ncbi:MAG: leucine--tRNA ligase [Candidatus Woesebacteria bacterium]|nr:MAG: leucine--tRNA ligase [Candidatus Woesebacteria bacterium]
MKYKHNEIEKKWQDKWEESGTYRLSNKLSKEKKKYVLDMFPYPSGATMHVGHLEGYIGTDIVSRYLRMNGFSVLHPMGWDAFGLPAENYAIKTGIHPDRSTHQNIEIFKRQLKISGLSYDWSHEIDTSDPDFYRWTQWLFIQLFKKGLAYKKKAAVNWCPKDETVLANEQVINGKCERCDTDVVQKELDQWFFKITAYADRLISGLKRIDWPEEVKLQQKKWIGKKEGIIIKYKVEDSDFSVDCWTSRPDTNFGATFIVISPESSLVNKLTKEKYKKEMQEYVRRCQNTSKDDRISERREKTGVFSGSYAINDLNHERLPIWVSDYVLTEVGTGAVIGVPGHDKRDFEFAHTFGLLIKRVIVGKDKSRLPITKIDQVQEEGKMINSEFLDGFSTKKAISKMMDYLVEKGWGKKETHYHLRDWLISRQRYWGAPIPMVYCEDCGWQPISESDLPVLLPKDVDFLPHGDSPIARSKEFQKNVKCSKCGKSGKREVDTMDTYVDSSWYFIRFVDSKNQDQFASLENTSRWLPVDIYVGGGHVVQHLLFARFFWKFLYDEGLIDKKLGDEPFLRLKAPGWILGPDSRKMSKRWGNVVTPDDIIPKFGADVLRLYEMFMGPFEVVKPWSITGVEGMDRFLKRVWNLFNSHKEIYKDDKNLQTLMHQTIKKVTNDIENFRYNTAISSIMQYVNFMRDNGVDNESLRVLCKLLAPFAPHMMEEVWVNILKEKFSVHSSFWPKYEEKLAKNSAVSLVLMVDGHPRGELSLSGVEVSKEEIIDLAHKNERVNKAIGQRKVKNTIYIERKLLNFVTK